jgi:hypothetical protein
MLLYRQHRCDLPLQRWVLAAGVSQPRLALCRIAPTRRMEQLGDLAPAFRRHGGLLLSDVHRATRGPPATRVPRSPPSRPSAWPVSSSDSRHAIPSCLTSRSRPDPDRAGRPYSRVLMSVPRWRPLSKFLSRSGVAWPEGHGHSARGDGRRRLAQGLRTGRGRDRTLSPWNVRIGSFEELIRRA